jgi:hypothetical protein
MEVYFHSFFELGTRWRWVVSFTPRPLYTQGRAPGTLWIGGWVGPRVGLDTVWKRRIPAPTGNWTPHHPARSPALYHWAILALSSEIFYTISILPMRATCPVTLVLLDLITLKNTWGLKVKLLNVQPPPSSPSASHLGPNTPPSITLINPSIFIFHTGQCSI